VHQVLRWRVSPASLELVLGVEVQNPKAVFLARHGRILCAMAAAWGLTGRSKAGHDYGVILFLYPGGL
jgi:hypothetical protein